MIKAMLSIAMGCILWSGSAGAQQRNLGPSTGSVSIRQLQVAFIGSGAIGGGALKFGGRSYGITVAGLGIGGIGASRLLANGPVYGLKRVDDFVGAYVQLREGWAIGDEGRGRLWLRNAKGVTLRLNTQRRGLQISLGADGVVIGFKQ